MFTQSDNVSGVPTDGGIWLWGRKDGDFYNHGFVDLSNGRAPIGLDTASDADNTTLLATVATWTDVTITFGTVSRDLNNGNGAQNYDAEINCGGRPMTEVYERLKERKIYIR